MTITVTYQHTGYQKDVKVFNSIRSFNVWAYDGYTQQNITIIDVQVS